MKHIQFSAALKSHVLKIYGTIGDFWSNLDEENIEKQIESYKTGDQVDLRINSSGGSVFAGYFMYNLLRKSKANITTYIDGRCCSMASYVMLAGSKIIMAANAKIMIHNPSGPSTGDAETLLSTAKLLSSMEDDLVAGYKTRMTNHSENDIREMMRKTTWFSAEQALEAGLIDEITGALQIAACADDQYQGNMDTSGIPERLMNLVDGSHMPPVTAQNNLFDSYVQEVKALEQEINQRKNQRKRHNEEIEALNNHPAIKEHIENEQRIYKMLGVQN